MSQPHVAQTLNLIYGNIGRISRGGISVVCGIPRFSDDVVDEKKIGGALVDLLRSADEKLNAHNFRSVEIESAATHTESEPYPPAAVRQILYNAVLHRTYESTNAPIRFYWFNDRIEITSPGGPYGNVTIANFGEPGITDYRNPNIADVLKTFGYVQAFGRGIAVAKKGPRKKRQPRSRVRSNRERGGVHYQEQRMSAPILTFFNNKGGVGKTSLVYHLAWTLADADCSVLVLDLAPQANLTAAFLDEDDIESLWETTAPGSTIFSCVKPLTGVADILPPTPQRISPHLHLIAGDVRLSGFEEILSSAWPDSMGDRNLYRPMRIESAFWQVATMGAEAMDADIVLVDVGPNLGAINRSALIVTDHVVIPLGADLFSLQGLKNLGPTLKEWKSAWQKRIDNFQNNPETNDYPEFRLPEGGMAPIGYLCQQATVRLKRPVKAYDKWLNRIPSVFREYVLAESLNEIEHLNYPEQRLRV